MSAAPLPLLLEGDGVRAFGSLSLSAWEDGWMDGRRRLREVRSIGERPPAPFPLQGPFPPPWSTAPVSLEPLEEGLDPSACASLPLTSVKRDERGKGETPPGEAK